MNWTLVYNNTENSCIFVVFHSLFPDTGIVNKILQKRLNLTDLKFKKKIHSSSISLITVRVQVVPSSYTEASGPLVEELFCGFPTETSIFRLKFTRDSKKLIILVYGWLATHIPLDLVLILGAIYRYTSIYSQERIERIS